MKCTHKGVSYSNGASVVIPEQPCLSCTCRQSVLQCFLRVCPPMSSPPAHNSTRAGELRGACAFVKEANACCPVLRCSSQQPQAAHATSVEPLADDSLVERTANAQPAQQAHVASSVELSPSAQSEGGGVPEPAKEKEARESVLLISSMPQQANATGAHQTPQASDDDSLNGEHSSASGVQQLGAQSSVEYSLMMDALIDAIYARATQLSGLSNLHGSCNVNNSIYVEGSAILSADLANKEKCQYCYCIRQKVMCVRPKCHLSISGCTARYSSEFACCPTSYECVAQQLDASSSSATATSPRQRLPTSGEKQLQIGNGTQVIEALESMARLTSAKDKFASSYQQSAADEPLTARDASSAHSQTGAQGHANIYGALSRLVKTFSTPGSAQALSDEQSNADSQLAVVQQQADPATSTPQAASEPKANSSQAGAESSFLESMSRLGPMVAQPESPSTCDENGRLYAIGEQIPTIEKCRHCYCGAQGLKECKIVECSLKQALDNSCTPIIPDGHCCPVKYDCSRSAPSEQQTTLGQGSDATLVSAGSSSLGAKKSRLDDEDESLASHPSNSETDVNAAQQQQYSEDAPQQPQIVGQSNYKTTTTTTSTTTTFPSTTTLHTDAFSGNNNGADLTTKTPMPTDESTSPLPVTGLPSVEPVLVERLNASLNQLLELQHAEALGEKRRGSGSSFDYANVELESSKEAAATNKQQLRDSRSTSEQKFAELQQPTNSPRASQKHDSLPAEVEFKSLDFYMNPIENSSSVEENSSRFGYDSSNATVDNAVPANVHFDDDFALAASSRSKTTTNISSAPLAARQDFSLETLNLPPVVASTSASSVNELLPDVATAKPIAAAASDDQQAQQSSSSPSLLKPSSQALQDKNDPEQATSWMRSLVNSARSFGLRLVKQDSRAPQTAHRAVPQPHSQAEQSPDKSRQRSLDLSAKSKPADGSDIGAVLGDIFSEFITNSLSASAATTSQATRSPASQPQQVRHKFLPLQRVAQMHTRNSNLNPNSRARFVVAPPTNDHNYDIFTRSPNFSFEEFAADDKTNAFGARTFSRRSDASLSPVTQAPITDSKSNCFDPITKRSYKNNERIPRDDSCTTCVCLLGKEMCQKLQCPQKPDSENCRPEFTRGRCCPEYVCASGAQPSSQGPQAVAPNQLPFDRGLNAASQQMQFGARFDAQKQQAFSARRELSSSHASLQPMRPQSAPINSKLPSEPFRAADLQAVLPAHLRFRPYESNKLANGGSPQLATAASNGNEAQKSRVHFKSSGDSQPNSWPATSNLLAAPAIRFSQPLSGAQHFKPIAPPPAAQEPRTHFPHSNQAQFTPSAPASAPEVSSPVFGAPSAESATYPSWQTHLSSTEDSLRLSPQNSYSTTTTTSASAATTALSASTSATTAAPRDDSSPSDTFGSSSFAVSECDAFGKTYKVGETISELSSGNACKKCTCQQSGVECAMLC